MEGIRSMKRLLLALAFVASYLPDTGRLCLTGASVEDHEGVNEDGRLCGRWRRMETTGAAPEEGEWFRFVAISVGAAQEGGSARGTLIYGDVLR